MDVLEVEKESPSLKTRRYNVCYSDRDYFCGHRGYECDTLLAASIDRTARND